MDVHEMLSDFILNSKNFPLIRNILAELSAVLSADFIEGLRWGEVRADCVMISRLYRLLLRKVSEIHGLECTDRQDSVEL